MESFLYNNPQILGEFRDENGKIQRPAVLQQFPTERGKDKKGYIDLMALSQNSDLDFVLKIIELKKIAFKDDFTQLQDYLEGLSESNPQKNTILNFIRNNSGVEDPEKLNEIYNNVIGVFIACDFEPELIVNIKSWNDNHSTNLIDLYKLLVFKTKKSTFVVLDKIINILGKPKRTKISVSWTELAKKVSEFTVGDLFYIDETYTNGDKIYVKTTDSKMNVTLIQESIQVMRDKDYLDNSKIFGSDPENFTNLENPEYMTSTVFPKQTWENKKIKRILSEEESLDNAEKIQITFSNLLQLVFFANGINKAGWIPATYYIHEKTGKKYVEFREALKEK